MKKYMLKQIQVTNFLRVCNGERMWFHNTIVALITPIIDSLPVLERLWKRYLEALLEEQRIFTQNPNAEKTEAVADAYIKCFIGVGAFVSSIEEALLCKEPDCDYPDIVAAAEECKYLLNNCYNITNKPNIESSTHVRKLIIDIRSDKYANSINLLNLTGYADMLEEYNNAFEEIYDELPSDIPGKTVKTAMYEIRPKLDQRYNAFVGGINVLYSSNDMHSVINTGQHDQDLHATLEYIIDAINDYRMQLDRIVFRRIHKGKDDSATETLSPGFRSPE
jgi:hypothetical protein